MRLVLAAVTSIAIPIVASGEVVAPPAGPQGIERLRSLATLPYLEPAASSGHFSSHARDGTNTDAYFLTDPGDPNRRAYLYRDNEGRFVLVDVTGPGAITRFWMTQIATTFGDMHNAGRLQIFFDGESTPRVDLPASEIFSGTTAPFLAPLCGDYVASSGGNYCYVPMPFQSGVRVAVTGQPNFWNFDYESYPQGTPVETFDPFSEATLAGASAAAELWNKAGTDPGILPAGAVHEGTVSLPPGSSVLLFARSGSGTLRAIGISGIEPHGDADLRGVSLEATWDGHAEPDIAAPLADLFLSGVGERGAARGLLAGYLPGSHEGYLFFPMPFTTGASVRLRNQGANAVTAGWRVEESPALYDSIGERAGELRATFRAEATTATGKDYRLFEGNGAGAVVGLSYTEEGPHSPSLTVFMEGDERVYIDGSKTPQIYGTGTEDIFNGGFYYSTGPFTRPTHGATAKEAAPMGAVVSQYRLLLADPWGFRRSIRVGIEHGGGDGIVTSTRSVVFWYALAGPGTAASDAIDVGEVASEAAHEYQSESPGTFTLTAFYEGEEDGNISSPVLDATILPGSLPAPAGDPMGESVTDDGRYHPPGSTIEFQVQVDSENAGVILRRRLDQLTFSQRALVLVDGVSAGVWSTPTVNDAKRWADSDFALPASLCQGKGALSITLVVLGPIRPPLVAGGLPDEATAPNLPSLNLPLDQGWSDFRYEVFSLR